MFSLIFFYYWWGGTKSTRYWGHFWPIVQTPDDRWGWLWSNWWTEDWQGKPKYSEKTCPGATLSTTNVPPLMSETRFHTHTEPQAKL
jgi:hypothetical protein